jgi:hypothetical protein
MKKETDISIHANTDFNYRPKLNKELEEINNQENQKTSRYVRDIRN